MGAIMALQCNIDARGKAVRLVGGIVTLLAGVGLAIAWAWPAGGVVAWGVTAACLAAGAFMVFEARTGWCVVRAMGIRTWV